MYRPIIAALIAATALASPALAQDRHRGGRGGDSNQGQGQGQGSSGYHGQWRQQQPAAQPAPQPQAQPQYRRQWTGGQQQVQSNGGQQAQQYRRDRANRGQWNGGGQQQQQQQPQQFRRDRGQWNGNTGVVPQQYRGQRGGSGYRAQGGRGGWSNGWRNDNRYNWRGYRNQNRNAFHLPRYYAPRGYGYGYQRFSIGLTIGSLLFAPQYWIDDPWSYRLPDAYGPYRWVRYFNDALLVDIDTGEVVDVEYDIFW